MKSNRNTNRFIAILALVFILFQSFALPAMAVSSWNGDSWEGNEWEGSPWEGNTWEGDPWEGSDWQGNEWESNEWQGNEWQGNNQGSGDSWQGSPWEGSNWTNVPWSMNPWNSNNWTGNGWNGNPGSGGDSWSGNGWNGNPGSGGSNWTGNGWNGNPGSGGNSWNGTPGSGNNWNGTPFIGSPFDGQFGLIPGVTGPSFNPAMPGTGNGGSGGKEGIDPYKVGKYIGDTVINGQVKMIADSIGDPDKFSRNFTSRTNYLTRVAASGFKLGYDGSLPADMLIYGHDSADKFFKTKDSLDKLAQFRATRAAIAGAGDLAETAASSTSSVVKMTPLSKLNVATAGVSAGFAAYDTYKAYGSYKVAKTGTEKGEAIGGMMASGGDFLMSAGTMMAAVPIPGVQAVGAGIIVAGGLLWGAGTATKLISRHWTKITGAARRYVTWRENAKRKVFNAGAKLVKFGFKSLFSK